MFVCPRCGWSSGLQSAPSNGYLCPRCGSPLDIQMDKMWNPGKGERGLRRYSSMLPLMPSKTLGEGSTPTVFIDDGGRRIAFKLEMFNPGGSFKDRGANLAVAHASMSGFRCLVEDTSGNTGISITLFGRVYGMKTKIVLPRTAPQGKRRIMELLGAEIIEAPSRSEATNIAFKISSSNCLYVNHLANPLFIEGAKTIAYEAFEDIGIPDKVIVPVGSGGLMLGIAKGFREVASILGYTKVPQIVAVQGVDVAPLYETLYGSKPSIQDTATLADGIRVAHPPRIEEMKKVVIESRGSVVLVNNNHIVEALAELVDLGFIVEPTSAAAYAAYKLIKENINPGETVLIPLTGSGLKMIDQLVELIRRARQNLNPDVPKF